MKFTCDLYKTRAPEGAHNQASGRKVVRGYRLMKCDAEIPKLEEAGSVSLPGVVRDMLVSLNLEAE